MKKYDEMTMEDKKDLLLAFQVKASFTILEKESDIPNFYKQISSELGYDLSVHDIANIIKEFSNLTYYIQAGDYIQPDGKPLIAQRFTLGADNVGTKLISGDYSETPIEEILDYAEKT